MFVTYVRFIVRCNIRQAGSKRNIYEFFINQISITGGSYYEPDVIILIKQSVFNAL